MKRLTNQSLILFLFVSLFVSCTSGSSDVGEAQSVMLHHAGLLRIEKTDSFTCVHVRNAWDTAQVLATYVLVPHEAAMPNQHPAGTVVRTPLRRVALTSSVHASLLNEFGATGSIIGMTDTAYVVSPVLKQMLTSGGGNVRGLGSSVQPDLELFRSAQPDAVFVSPFENAGHGGLERLGIPLIECADYMESSPLARAEWMRFFGLLMGCETQADSLFTEVENTYTDLCTKAQNLQGHRPTVFCDMRSGATWYEPGGASTMGQMLRDAGADYLWADRRESGSLALDFESVFARGRNADVWLLKYGATVPLTYTSLTADYAHYSQFRAWRERHIWACNTFITPFYEETPFHPERLLHNLIHVLHPQLLPGEPDTTYYVPMNE